MVVSTDDGKLNLFLSKGLYPVAQFPSILGREAAGVIIALPTDENVLNNEEYKLRGLKVGSKVAVVGLPKIRRI